MRDVILDLCDENHRHR